MAFEKPGVVPVCVGGAAGPAQPQARLGVMPSPPPSAPGTGRDSQASLATPPGGFSIGLTLHVPAVPLQGSAGLPGHPKLLTLPSWDGEKLLGAPSLQKLLLEEHPGVLPVLSPPSPRCSSSQPASWSTLEPPNPHIHPQPRMQERGGSSPSVSLSPGSPRSR